MRSVVVTGGAQGIGLATARAFAGAGDAVVVLDSSAAALRELPTGIRGIQVDMSDAEAVLATCAQLTDSVDVLVNNVGIGGSGKSILDTEVEEWDRIIDVNLRSIWLMAKGLVPKMPPGSAIVNIASTRAFMSEPDTEAYAASKGGVVALTHSLAISLAPRKIRVNCICPGWIDVRAEARPVPSDVDELRPIDHEQHPVGRVGRAEDIADAVAFLTSPGAGFITGAHLTIDGGMTVKMIYAP